METSARAHKVGHPAGTDSPPPLTPVLPSQRSGLLPPPPMPFTVTWINQAGGDWDTASNWSTGVLPGATDNVGISTSQSETITHTMGSDTINSLVVGNDDIDLGDSVLTILSGATFGADLVMVGATLYLNNGNATIARLGMTADGGPFLTDSILNGSGTVTVTGNCLLGVGSGAEMTGSGTTILQGATTISAGTGSPVLGNLFGLDGGRILENTGTLTWASGQIELGVSSGGGIIQNMAGAVFDMTGGSAIVALAGVTGFTNAGLLEQTVTIAETDILTSLTNTGSLLVQSGTVGLGGGGSSAAGAITVATGATLAIENTLFTINGAGSLAIAGTLLLESSGQLQLGTHNASVANYICGVGDLYSNGTMSVTGSAVLGNGAVLAGTTFDGTGTCLLAGPTTLDGNFSLNAGYIMENAGTLTWLAGTITLGYDPFNTSYGGGTISNLSSGVFNIESNLELDSYVGPTLFLNAGLLEQTETSGATELYTAFINTGTIDVQSGILSLNGGGSSNASSLIVAAGTTLEFGARDQGGLFTLTGGTLNIAGSTILGVGELDASAVKIVSFGSTLTLTALANQSGFTTPGDLELGAQSFNVQTLLQSTSTLDGTGTVTVTQAATFNGMFETGTGTTLLDGTTTMVGNIYLAGDRTLQNSGTWIDTGGVIYLGVDPFANSVGGATLINGKGAIFDVETATQMIPGVGLDKFMNSGLFEQTETVGETDIYLNFLNASSGTISIKTGQLNFDGGGMSNASAFKMSNTATLGFNNTTPFVITGGTFNIPGALLLNGADLDLSKATVHALGNATIFDGALLELGASSATASTLVLAGASLDGTGTLTVSGNTIFATNYFSGPYISGTGVLLLQGSSTIETDLHVVSGRILENANTLTLASSGWNIDMAGGTLANLAGSVIDIQYGSDIANDSGSNLFTNAGTLVQTSIVAGVTDIYVNFTNTGSVIIDSGTLSFDGNGSSNASAFTVAEGATLGFGEGVGYHGQETFTITGGAFNLAGTLQLGGGTLNLQSYNEAVASFVLSTGYLEGSGTFTVAGNAAFYTDDTEQYGTGTTLLEGTTIADDAYIYLDAGRIMANSGTLVFEGGGQVEFGYSWNSSNIGGGTLSNLANGTISILTSEVFQAGYGVDSFRNAGLLTQSSGGQTIFDVAFSNSGTLDLISGTMSFTGGNFSGLMEGSGQYQFSGTTILAGLTFGGASATSNTGTILQSATVTLGDASGTPATFTNQAGALYDLTAATLAKGAGASSFTNDGTFASSGKSSLAAAFVNQGVISIGSGSLSFLGGLSNTGTINLQGGSLSVSTILTGTGTLDIGSSALATLSKGASSGTIVDFLAPSALDLSAPLKFAGTIQDFAVGDKIDLLKTTETSYNFSNGVLNILDGKKTVAALHFAGDYSTSSFTLTSDGHKGVVITHT